MTINQTISWINLKIIGLSFASSEWWMGSASCVRSAALRASFWLDLILTSHFCLSEISEIQLIDPTQSGDNAGDSTASLDLVLIRV